MKEFSTELIKEIEDYAIRILDMDGIIRTWNKGAEHVEGYLEAEILNQHFNIFYTGTDRDLQLPQQILNEAKLNGKALREGWRVRKNGEQFWGNTMDGLELIRKIRSTTHLKEIPLAIFSAKPFQDTSRK